MIRPHDNFPRPESFSERLGATLRAALTVLSPERRKADVPFFQSLTPIKQPGVLISWKCLFLVAIIEKRSVDCVEDQSSSRVRRFYRDAAASITALRPLIIAAWRS